MDKRDFLFGFVSGIAIALLFSFFIFNYYVVKKIESTKQEVKQSVEGMQEIWREDLKEKVEDWKTETKEKLKEEGLDLLGKVKDRINEKVQESEAKQDSLNLE